MKEYVYILKCNDAIKIGFTTNIEKRMKAHQTSNPFVKFICKYEATSDIEKLIHKKLSKHLKKGCTEWFNYYEGIYNDIELIINNEKGIETLKQGLNKEGFKTFNFKDNNNNYAIVAAKNLARALKILAYESFTIPIFHSEIKINGTNIEKEYIIKSTFISKKEYVFCKRNLIDLNKEYGITYNRLTNLMTKDNLTINEELWNKSIKKTYSKTFKNSKQGRRKKKY